MSVFVNSPYAGYFENSQKSGYFLMKKYKILYLKKDIRSISIISIIRMPSPTYEQNKPHIYIWREKNRCRHREIDLKAKRWKKIKMEFLAILLN